MHIRCSHSGTHAGGGSSCPFHGLCHAHIAAYASIVQYRRPSRVRWKPFNVALPATRRQIEQNMMPPLHPREYVKIQLGRRCLIVLKMLDMQKMEHSMPAVHSAIRLHEKGFQSLVCELGIKKMCKN